VRGSKAAFGASRSGCDRKSVLGVVTVEVMLGVVDVMGSWAPTGYGVKDFSHRHGGFKT
jgi:hypothetical protein